MGTLLAALYEYHQRTLRLYQVKQQIESSRRRARIHERKLTEYDGQLAQLREQVKKAQAAAGEAELDLRTREASVEKLRGQLNAAKTNKEYSAILREINSQKADASHIEEQALKKLADVDELKGRLAKMQGEADQEKARFKELAAQAKAREEVLAQEAGKLEQQRRQAGEALPADVIVQVDRVAEAHDGEALAPILKPYPKREEYICGGCNMGVTLEQVNALQTRDDLQACNVCGRVLYLPESVAQTRT